MEGLTNGYVVYVNKYSDPCTMILSQCLTFDATPGIEV